MIYAQTTFFSVVFHFILLADDLQIVINLI